MGKNSRPLYIQAHIGVKPLHSEKYRGPNSAYLKMQRSNIYIPGNIWVIQVKCLGLGSENKGNIWLKLSGAKKRS